MSTVLFKANDSYNSSLSASYTNTDTVIYLNTPPANVPTILVLAYGTVNQKVISCTAKTLTSITGVTFLRGAATDSDPATPVTCLDNEEFINQFTNIITNEDNPVLDTAGNELETFTKTASAVNNINITNSATGTGPTISSVGGDTNVNLKLKPKGTGILVSDGAENYAADAGSTDTYAITVGTISAYATGQVFKFKANTVNTGVASLNVNAIGAKSIHKNYDSDLSDGDIRANQLVAVIYDGTYFQMLSPTSNGTAYGELGHTIVTTSQGSITGLADITNLNVTVTVPAGRSIKISVWCQFLTTVASDSAGLSIVESSTQLTEAVVFIGTTAGIQASTFAQVILTPSAGSHTYKAQARRANGTGTLTVNSTATTPSHILVELI